MSSYSSNSRKILALFEQPKQEKSKSKSTNSNIMIFDRDKKIQFQTHYEANINAQKLQNFKIIDNVEQQQQIFEPFTEIINKDIITHNKTEFRTKELYLQRLNQNIQQKQIKQEQNLFLKTFNQPNDQKKMPIFKLRFEPDKILDLRIRDSKQKYQNKKLMEYEDPMGHTFRDDYPLQNKKPFIIKFKPGEFKYFSDHKQTKIQQEMLRSQRISQEIQNTINIKQATSQRFFKNEKLPSQV